MGQLGLGNQTDAVPSPTQVAPPLPCFPLLFWVKKQRFGVFTLEKTPLAEPKPLEDAGASLLGMLFHAKKNVK